MARQRLGQHFLARRSVLDRIARAACPEQTPLVVEIGPGQGALTEYLLDRAQRVIAVEVDQRLVERLRGRFEGHPHLEIVAADVLETDLGQWGPAVVAGNLPYYITSPILQQVLAMGPALIRGVFLMQEEVAQRVATAAGSRDYGFLSVAVQFRCRVTRLMDVPPAAFRPPPKVDSAVLELVPDDRFPGIDGTRFIEFASLCFRHKRKNLRNNLGGAYGLALMDRQPEARLRAEQLSIPALVDLWSRLEALRAAEG